MNITTDLHQDGTQETHVGTNGVIQVHLGSKFRSFNHGESAVIFELSRSSLYRLYRTAGGSLISVILSSDRWRTKFCAVSYPISSTLGVLRNCIP